MSEHFCSDTNDDYYRGGGRGSGGGCLAMEVFKMIELEMPVVVDSFMFLPFLEIQKTFRMDDR